MELTFRTERARVTVGVILIKKKNKKNVSGSSDTLQHGLVIDSPTTPQGLRYRALC